MAAPQQTSNIGGWQISESLKEPQGTRDVRKGTGGPSNLNCVIAAGRFEAFTRRCVVSRSHCLLPIHAGGSQRWRRTLC
eukprot:2632101-Amphidinium_carterae.1